MKIVEPLIYSQLRTLCDFENFSFKTTSDLKALKYSVGQDRAIDAINFGIAMKKKGYNIFALGKHGIEKHSIVKGILSKQVVKEYKAQVWCYVYNFDNPRNPKFLQLPSSIGKKITKDMQSMVEKLKLLIPDIIKRKTYLVKIQHLEKSFESKKRRQINVLRKKARKENIAILARDDKFEINSMFDGKMLSAEDFEALSIKHQKEYEIKIEKYLVEVEDLVERLAVYAEALEEAEDKLTEALTKKAIKSVMLTLKQRYEEFPKLVQYLDEVEQDIILNFRGFYPSKEGMSMPNINVPMDEYSFFLRYEVNVFVEHSFIKKPPVVYEANPTYLNLVGRIESISQLGILITNHTLIRSGALHAANHGYLLLDLHQLLTNPYAWEGLKRILYAEKIMISPLEQILGVSSTVSLEPEDIPLDLKVILFGDRDAYALLCEFDLDFKALFKVVADFDEVIERNRSSELKYAKLVAGMVQEEKLRPFDAKAVGAVIEYASVLAEDAGYLTMRHHHIKELLCEADHCAANMGRKIVRLSDVMQANEAKTLRNNRLKKVCYKNIEHEFTLINTHDEHVGQVNGLSIVEQGDFKFGQPSRITATSRLGRGAIVDIERQVNFGGPIHTKGMLILSGFLRGRYAKHYLLSLSASIVLEQNYGVVEGDSASLAELCALLSSIANLPIKQKFAVTGSVNQHGQVQAIGGVNQKIEGFFDVCQLQGLHEGQGVLIPAVNVKQLMLREDIVLACKLGKFNIYPVNQVDEAMSILTGISSGERDQQGAFPKHTVNHLIEETLITYCDLRKQQKPS